jgi:hypothetical protein
MILLESTFVLPTFLVFELTVKLFGEPPIADALGRRP